MRKTSRFMCSLGEESEALGLPFGVENGPSLVALVIISENQEYLSLAVFNMIRNIPEEKIAEMAEACNRVNEHIRYFKFVLNSSDRTIDVRYDFPILKSPDEAAETAVLMVSAMVHIIRESYSTLMYSLLKDMGDRPKEPEEEVTETGKSGHGTDTRMMS